jgi:hypothetical protein
MDKDMMKRDDKLGVGYLRLCDVPEGSMKEFQIPLSCGGEAVVNLAAGFDVDDPSSAPAPVSPPGAASVSGGKGDANDDDDDDGAIPSYALPPSGKPDPIAAPQYALLSPTTGAFKYRPAESGPSAPGPQYDLGTSPSAPSDPAPQYNSGAPPPSNPAYNPQSAAAGYAPMYNTSGPASAGEVYHTPVAPPSYNPAYGNPNPAQQYGISQPAQTQAPPAFNPQANPLAQPQQQSPMRIITSPPR